MNANNDDVIQERKMILLMIGFLGVMGTIAKYRKADVEFFSIITIFNRKEKLTEFGAKLYVGFFIVLLAGLVLKML
jgi:hypothetical protein